MQDAHGHGHNNNKLAALTLGALGVVYGDIGTSPLYALKECFNTSASGVPINQVNVYGILSLIFWALILIVTIKYLIFVMRADNKGEGGILALLALAFPDRSAEKTGKLTAGMLALGLLGACLLYGDGLITPAISVLGAVEGLGVATKSMADYVVPIAVVIIIGLFSVQRAGTAKVGKFFGPITLVWFLCIAALGILHIKDHPGIFQAFLPNHAFTFLSHNPWAGFKVLGSVVLVVTGGEALYADMGHFGRQPIRIAWFAVVLPCLLLNYLGQGALLLSKGVESTKDFHPFYGLCPEWALYPMVGIATAAAIIASQALISGAYSLTMQAIQLGYMPRLMIEHTSEQERGQIYMPQVNWALMLGCIALVVGFGSSEHLAAAYGIAVTSTMIITTLLLYFAARRVWGWEVWQAGLVSGLAVLVELPFAGANFLKIHHGGWFPLLLALGIFLVMSTWKRGRQILWNRIRSMTLPHSAFMEAVAGPNFCRAGTNAVYRHADGQAGKEEPFTWIGGTAIFMVGNPDGTPLALTHNLEHNKVLHERIIFLTVMPADAPRVSDDQRVSVEAIQATEDAKGFYRVKARVGFMEQPDVLKVLRLCEPLGLSFDLAHTTFFLSRETILPSDHPGMAIWRERLFSLLSRNAQSATAFFRLPATRVVELGMQVEI